MSRAINNEYIEEFNRVKDSELDYNIHLGMTLVYDFLYINYDCYCYCTSVREECAQTVQMMLNDFYSSTSGTYLPSTYCEGMDNEKVFQGMIKGLWLLGFDIEWFEFEGHGAWIIRGNGLGANL